MSFTGRIRTDHPGMLAHALRMEDSEIEKKYMALSPEQLENMLLEYYWKTNAEPKNREYDRRYMIAKRVSTERRRMQEPF